MKNILTALGATLLHLGMCVIECIIWKWNIIDPMAGWDGYSVSEKSFFVALFVLIVVLVTILIKRKKTIINILVFWSTSVILTEIIKVRIVFAELTDNITFIYGTNWLGSDMWALCFAACLTGTVAGILLSIRKGVNT